MDFESNEGFLGFREVREYFEYLGQVDEYFRGVFLDFPQEFQRFMEFPKFVQLRKFLKEKWVADARYDRGAYQHKKMFIERMKQYLAGMVGGPCKRRCMGGAGSQGNWHDAFSLFLSAARSQKICDKQDLKNKIQSLLHP